MERVCDASSLTLPQSRNGPTQQPINCNDPYHDANPFTGLPTSLISVLCEDSFPIDPALRSQSCVVHAVASVTTIVRTVREFVDHHTLKDVRLLSYHQHAQHRICLFVLAELT